jgi:cobalt/nickel transport system permease protein
MQHDFLDRYCRGDSIIHRASTAAKLLLALTVVVFTGAAPLPAREYFAAVTSLLVVVAVVARIPFRYLTLRLLLLEPFVIGVALLTLFQPGGKTVFMGILTKSTLSLMTMVLLANTTPFTEILRVARRSGMPALLVNTLALLYRYLFVLVDEAQRMQRARAARTFRPRSRRERWQMLGALAGELFVRSTERAERIYTAMCARGWR